MASAVGDTVIDGSALLAVHGGGSIEEKDLLRAIDPRADCFRAPLQQDEQYVTRD